jgi:protein ImuB
MRILCIHLPEWPIQRLLVADRGLDLRRPIILHSRDARSRQLVTACNSVAWKRGVRPSMPLAEAAALTDQREECTVVPANPAADKTALGRLAEHCERFSSLVGWETVDEVPPTPDSLFLDITGTAVLFGGEASLADEVVKDLARLGHDARVAIAATIGAAWARCVSGAGHDLPVSALRVPAETVALLAQLGVTHIAQLEKLPRASLRARFGERLLLRLDQFAGTAPETIVAHRPPPEFVAERVLEQGRLLCMFPGGTRSASGILGSAHGGAALLAIKSAAPIIPVAITGTPRIFLRDFPWVGLPRVTVTVGVPFDVRLPDRTAQRDDRDRVTGEIMMHIAALLPPELRGAHADGAPDAQIQSLGEQGSQGQMEQ